MHMAVLLPSNLFKSTKPPLAARPSNAPGLVSSHQPHCCATLPPLPLPQCPPPLLSGVQAAAAWLGSPHHQQWAGSWPPAGPNGGAQAQVSR